MGWVGGRDMCLVCVHVEFTDRLTFNVSSNVSWRSMVYSGTVC